ncbi:MAG TPA: cupin domain-containing protein [Gemmatimonadaceae bacterium]
MRHVALIGIAVPIVLLSGLASRALGQLEPMCVADSPERRGGIGCSLVETKLLPAGLAQDLFWHIDRFTSASAAQAAVGATSVAFAADGAWWLMTLESRADVHHGGTHVAAVRLLPLPPADRYAMLVISAYIPAGLTSRVHVHSGVEAFYVVDGEQCLETPTRTYPMTKGETAIVAAGDTMRLVATGPGPRRSFAVVVYDASKPPTTRPDNPPALLTCPRKSP